MIYFRKYSVLFFGMAIAVGTMDARTLQVGPKGFPRITDALLAAADHDTIRVGPGTYLEGTITIEKPVVLLGEGWPVIDGKGKGEVLEVKASNVTVSGFVITGTRVSDMNDFAAIKCLGVTDITLINNRIEHCFFGIHLNSVKRAKIENNRVIGDPALDPNRRANGIHLWKCNRISITGNRVEHHRDGIYLEFVTDSEITSDTSAFNARYGLHFMFSHRDRYTHNVFEDNGAGVAVMFTHDVVMTDNIFRSNHGASSYALLLKEINDATIERNHFVDNTIGVLVDGCNRAEVRDNKFESNGWAAKLYANSTACVFEGNTFTGNTFDVTTNGDLVLSVLKGNYWDRYRGYDLDRDGKGDVPYRPFGLFALVTERMPYAMVLSRSLMVQLLDQAERLLPSLTPKALEDLTPLMKPPHG